MESGYRLVFSGQSFYNEVDVLSGAGLVGIGTIAGCKARFSKDIFRQDFLATVAATDTGWQLKCEAGVYIKKDGTQLSEIHMQPGDFIPMYSCISHKELFKLTCMATYEDAPTTFDIRLNLRGTQQLIVGNTSHADLRLLDLGPVKEDFKLEVNGSYLRMTVVNMSVGVFVNGNRAVGITKIKNHDFISCGPYTFYFSDGYLYLTNSERMTLKNRHAEPVIESESALVYPKFNRNTRVKNVLPHEPITVLDPPEIPQKPADSLVMTLLPAVAMLVLVIVLRGVMSESAGTYVIFSVCSMALGIVTSIMNYRKSQKTYKNTLKEREETFVAYIARKREEIEAARKTEAEILHKNYPSARETLSRVHRFSGSLFDRTPYDEDYLHIRVGTGSRKALRTIAYKPKDTLVLGDELQETPEKIAKEYELIPDAPIVVPLKETGILGVVGDELTANEFLKVLIEDMCTRQYAKDVKMFAICTKEQSERNAWMRYIPHFQKETGFSRNIACDKDSCDMQFEFLYKTLSFRESVSNRSDFPAIVVFVLDQMGLYTHPVSKYLDKAKSLGVYFVFLAETREELPQYCGQMVQLKRMGTATLIDTADRSNAVDFTYEQLSDDTMWKMALKLSPVYCEDVSVESSLPKSFSLFALLGIQGVDDLDLGARWKKTDITKTMAAPLGLKAGDEVISLDLHEKYHGPHGLVAGTTGSGKSEILQTYILSMATLYSPDEVGFVIIDFKGGGMANLFSNLPHLMGAITDIDGKSIQRSLLSIRAEIDKRKRMFAEAEVNNIGDYIRKYKSGKYPAMAPLPHLILIIDEFAELKADQPEFMKEVISAARVGRSLGIHLILATQKPAGVIDEQIWSNSRFKLCLKVQSPSDSNEVLKSPLAAEIREPGRAYLQVGNNEIFELFQSAYSGSPAQSEELDHIKPFALYEMDDCGRRKPVYERKLPKTTGSGEKPETQLQALTDKIADYCKNAGVKRLPSICLPPLPAVLDFPAEAGGKAWSKNTAMAAVGYYDDPSTQSQNPVEIDLSANNTLIIGASQSGKTNLMMTMIRSLAERYTPEDVNMYIVDFGPSILSNFRSLPHVGGVVRDNEEEKLKNLFKLLNSEISLRKQKIMEANVSSLAAYREAGHTDLPWIVLFVDNFTALKELYLANEDFLLPICRNGLSVGISVVIANQNMQGLGFRYASSFSERIAMHCNDSNEYGTVIERCHVRPDNIPGRAVLAIDKIVYEMQVYSSFTGELETEKVQQQLRFMEQATRAAGSKHAKTIPMIPERLTVPQLQALHSRSNPAPLDIPLGLNYDTIGVVNANLPAVNAMALIGKPSDASQAVLGSLMHQLTAKADIAPAYVYLIDSHRRDLAAYKDLPMVKSYTTDPGAFAPLLETIHSEVVSRSKACAEKGYACLVDMPQLVVMVSGNDAITAMNKNSAAVTKYKEILDKYGDMKVCFLYTHLDNADPGYSGPEVLKRLKDTKSIFYFDALPKLRFIQPSQSALRQAAKLQPYDGFFFDEGEPVRFKAAIH